jgi:hypothetical protein
LSSAGLIFSAKDNFKERAMVANNSLEASRDRVRLATLFSGIGAPEFAARKVFDEVNTVFAF